MASEVPVQVLPPIYRFGDFELRAESGELFRCGAKVSVQEQSLRVLLALLANPGAVVSREQLCQRLWPTGTYVDFEHSLNAAVKRLRRALDDDAETPRYIETLPKRGYRLITEVSLESPQPSVVGEPVDSAVAFPRSFPRNGTVAVALLVLTVAAVFVVLWRRNAGVIPLAATSASKAAPPRNAEAYELYIRSLGYRREAPVNHQAIGLLERSTMIDSQSALSWYELSRRYGVEFTNPTEFTDPTGGQGLFEKAQEANRRALEIAPDFSSARLQQVIFEVWGGQVGPAYHAAMAMTRDHPRDANAHYALSIVLRYGGMYEDAANECDRAHRLDPSSDRFLACALVNVQLGRYDRVQTYLDTDPLSHVVRYRRMELAILRNDTKAALEEVRSIRLGPNSYFDARMLEAALSGADPEMVRRWSAKAEGLFDRVNTAEFYFVESRYQSYVGQTEPAIRLLRRAIANKYCSYPVMDSDPLLANVRRSPEYAELRQAGMKCRDDFRAQMNRP